MTTPQPIRVLRWVYRQQTYQIVRQAEARPIPYVLVDEHGQVLSGITERDLRWYRQRIKEQQR